MPDFINGLATQNGYVPDLELAPAPWTKQITFSVIAAVSGGVAQPVLATLAKYPALADGRPDFSRQPSWEPFERTYVGNTIGATITDWCGGIKFRSAIAGSPGFVVAERDFQTDIVVNSGNVSAASISSTGQTSPGGTSNVITGIIPAAGTTPTAGTGFSYTHTNGTGVYVFTFTNAFAATPDIQVTLDGTTAGFVPQAYVSAMSPTGFTVQIEWYNTGSGLVTGDLPFSFLAQAVA